MEADMDDENKLEEKLLRLEEIVKSNLEKYSELEVQEFNSRVRQCKFANNKIKWKKRMLIALQANQNTRSLFMNLITGEFYKSTQDFIRITSLEDKIEFYEYEIKKFTGVTGYVPYQREFDSIDFSDSDYENLEEEQKNKNILISNLYEQSLRWTILKNMGLKD
jgi:hypothetical protein